MQDSCCVGAWVREAENTAPSAYVLLPTSVGGGGEIKTWILTLSVDSNLKVG